MRLYEILTEQEIKELQEGPKLRSLKNLAAAGVLGTAVALSPAGAAPLQGQVAPEEPAQTQVVEPLDIKPEVKPEVPSKAEVAPKSELPKEMASLPVGEKKKIFFDTLEPLVKKVNQEILKQRDRVLAIKNDANPSAKDQQWLATMYKKYRIEDGNIDQLLLKVDAVPKSLALSQAAIESGWGTSRFAQEGNALFGQRDYSGKGIKPKGAAGFTVAKFGSLQDSIAGYIKNLNTQSSYKDFRTTRAKMRTGGEELDGIQLAKTLGKYSERGGAYISDVISVIKTNKLQ